MSVNDRGLERPLLREEVIAHGDEAVQLPAALVRRPLSPQDKGKGGSGGRGHGHPNAPGEQVLPGQDALILRQTTEGIQPVLQLSQSGISRGPDRRGRVTTDGIAIVAVAAGRILGFTLITVHLGISFEITITTPWGVTVDADSGNHCWSEGNALGESSPVHEALLEEG